MSMNSNRGEMEIRLGNETYTMKFRFTQLENLEAKLEMDALAWIANQKSTNTFLKYAVFYGVGSKSLGLPKVVDGLDNYAGDLEDLKLDIMYAIARGKPGKTGDKIIEALDELRAGDDDEEGPGPTLAD